jgi:uncharacterized membrane protein
MNVLPGFLSVDALAQLRDKYWFLPALSAIAGLLAGIGVVAADTYIGTDWLGRFDTLHGSRPEGARAMLSAIAGSTITVAGVVFSITLAAVTYASGQHGPRLLTNFARDRGNQLTLGVFVGTYVYCLIVLRTIRSASEENLAPAFVPHLAVYGALILALASIGVLIYFFHHVTESIHINKVIARIGRQLIETLRRQVQDGADSIDEEKEAGVTTRMNKSSVTAKCAGYIASIDLSTLTKLAEHHDGVVSLHCRAGDFVHNASVLLDFASDQKFTQETKSKLQDAVTIGDQKTDLQDLRFGFDELTEIAIRALSPGINDPFTAIACVDWLSAALLECDRIVLPAGAETSGSKRLVQTRPLTFSDFVAITFGRLRQHASTEATVKASVSQALASLANNVTSTGNRSILLTEAGMLRRCAP